MKRKAQAADREPKRHRPPHAPKRESRPAGREDAPAERAPDPGPDGNETRLDEGGI